jgi:signal transduction histidine kinase
MLEEVLSKFAGLVEYSKPVQSLPKPIIIEPVIAKYLENSKDIISTKKINIIAKIQPGVMASLSKPALHQLVSSIIGNSIKFSKEGATIEIRLDSVSNKMRFIVKDTGIGIEPVKLKQLMAPFSRATDVLKFDYEGIGLSLYLNKVLLEQVGGSLEIISKLNAGTAVVVYLPDIK